MTTHPNGRDLAALSQLTDDEWDALPPDEFTALGRDLSAEHAQRGADERRHDSRDYRGLTEQQVADLALAPARRAYVAQLLDRWGASRRRRQSVSREATETEAARALEDGELEQLLEVTERQQQDLNVARQQLVSLLETAIKLRGDLKTDPTRGLRGRLLNALGPRLSPAVAALLQSPESLVPGGPHGGARRRVFDATSPPGGREEIQRVLGGPWEEIPGYVRRRGPGTISDPSRDETSPLFGLGR